MGDKNRGATTLTPEKLSRGRLVTFRLVSLFLPLILLAALEGILRLRGLGGYPPIIRKAGKIEAGTLVITDPAGAISYFFANRDRPGFNEQYSFVDPKPPKTIRIILVGESAMKGFPEPRNLAASAFLARMLQEVWPDRNAEVINLGTTAVASFPVLEILTEALDYNPDLVIVSTGHNEFFGTYGVCSIGWGGSRPWMLKANRMLRSLALVQAMEKLAYHSGTQPNKTLMELMIGRSYTAANDWHRNAAARNLEHNVGKMIERCNSRGVPILICTQPSNERELSPFGADPIADLTRSKRQEFEAVFQAGRDLLPQNASQATEKLKAAIQLCPTHARAHYYLGKALLGAGRPTEALSELIQARDFDTLPWRATSLSQEALTRAAKAGGAQICDLEKTFREHSPQGAIGWELMDDHVHPTVAGQALIARSIVQSLTGLPGPLHVEPAAAASLGSWEGYAKMLGDNVYDRYGVAHTMRVIFGISFMKDTNPEAFVRFDRAAAEIENKVSPELREVLHEWQTVNPHAGGKRPLTGMVARVLMRQGKYAEALDLLHIAQRSVPEYTSWHMEYVYFALACEEKLYGPLTPEQKAEALAEIKQGEFLLQHGFSESGLTERYLGRLHQLRGEFAEAIPFLLASRPKLGGNDLVAADEALVVSYIKLGRFDEAREIANNGVLHSGVYARTYEQMLQAVSAGDTNKFEKR
jgi:tetratricopeptide (TPR) repeat protein